VSDGVRARPSVLVMARAPRPGACKRRLEALLGPAGCARLQRSLLLRTLAWAGTTGAAFAAVDPPDAVAEVAALTPPGTELLAPEGVRLGDRLATATAHVLGRRSGPLLVVGTDLPVLGPVHAAAALGDLAAGCDVTIGPALDGGCYLVAISAPRPELCALPAELWCSRDVMGLTLSAARRLGLEVGLLRPERLLVAPQDARAALEDPLFPPDVAALLAPTRARG
jgi:glycosyltransferase A (GT-A) superfamily protein (DUF2064 family)